MKFGLFVGLFLVAWGLFEMGQSLGWIPSSYSFPWFPLILILVGLWLIAKRVRRF